MRTTLTIDDDVAVLLEQEVRRTGDSFKGTVNRVLRKGLFAAPAQQAQKPFQVKPFPIGVNGGRRYEGVSALLEELEGPAWK